MLVQVMPRWRERVTPLQSVFSYPFCYGQRRTGAYTVVLSCMHAVVEHRPSLDRGYELLTSVLALIHVAPFRSFGY